MNLSDVTLSLGYKYLNGEGVRPDYEKSREYFETAVKGGNKEIDLSDIMFIIGCKYFNGEHVDQNNEKAIEYFEKSLQLNNLNNNKGRVYYYLGKLYKNQDPGKAKEYYEKSVTLKYPDSLFELANMFLTGNGQQLNYSMALHYLEEASRKGHPQALYSLAEMYVYGKGVDVDYKKAIEYLEKVIASGDINAMLRSVKLIANKIEDLTTAISILILIHQKTNDEKYLHINTQLDIYSDEYKPIMMRLFMETYAKTGLKIYFNKIKSELDRYSRYYEPNNLLEQFMNMYVDMLKHCNNQTQKINELKNKIKDLETEIYYKPDGPGYFEAKKHFEEMITTHHY